MDNRTIYREERRALAIQTQQVRSVPKSPQEPNGTPSSSSSSCNRGEGSLPRYKSFSLSRHPSGGHIGGCSLPPKPVFWKKSKCCRIKEEHTTFSWQKWVTPGLDERFIELNVPTDPADVPHFYQLLRQGLVDESSTHEEGKMKTIPIRKKLKEKMKYTNYVLKTGSRLAIIKMQRQTFYIPAFLARPKNRELLCWHEFDHFLSKGRKLVPESLTLPYSVAYDRIENAADITVEQIILAPMDLTRVLHNLSGFDETLKIPCPNYAQNVIKALLLFAELARFGGRLHEKLISSFTKPVEFGLADSSMLRVWGCLCKLHFFYKRFPQLVQRCFDDAGVNLEIFLDLVADHVAVLKSLTFDEEYITDGQVKAFCEKFTSDYKNEEEPLHYVFA